MKRSDSRGSARGAAWVCVACLLATLSHGACAQEPAAAATPAAPTDVVTVVTNILARDPFWPVGYAPRVVEEDTGGGVTNPPPARSGVVIRWPKLTLKGVMKTSEGRYVGLMPGVAGLIEGGEKIRMLKDGVEYEWRVVGVGPEGASCERIEARVVAPKKRGGL